MSGFKSMGCIAIDTNIFEGLLNSEKNFDSHIGKVLNVLQDLQVSLIVDDKKRIANEYKDRISPIIESSNDIGSARYALNYWILKCRRFSVSVNLSDELMNEIKNVIHEQGESVDRIFVYVAFKEGKILITNDETHIVCGPKTKKGNRRDQLLKALKKLKRKYPNYKSADILTSQNAHAKIIGRQ